MQWVTKIEGFDAGGNCPVDFVTLWDGRILAINNECVVLYESMTDFLVFETSGRRAINLKR